MTGKEITAKALSKYYSKKFRGKVSSWYDYDEKKYYISGSNLPTSVYFGGWSLLDSIKPSKARQIILKAYVEGTL